MYSYIRLYFSDIHPNDVHQYPVHSPVLGVLQQVQHQVPAQPAQQEDVLVLLRLYLLHALCPGLNTGRLRHLQRCSRQGPPHRQEPPAAGGGDVQ